MLISSAQYPMSIYIYMHLPLKIEYSNVYEYRYIKIYCLSYHHNEHITQLVLFHGWIRLTKNGHMEDVLLIPVMQMKTIYDMLSLLDFM